MRDATPKTYIVPLTEVYSVVHSNSIEAGWQTSRRKVKVTFTPAPEFVRPDRLTMLEREMIMAETRG